MLPTKKICANCNEAAIRKLLTVCPEAEIVRQFSVNDHITHHILMSCVFTGCV